VPYRGSALFELMASPPLDATRCLTIWQRQQIAATLRSFGAPWLTNPSPFRCRPGGSDPCFADSGHDRARKEALPGFNHATGQCCCCRGRIRFGTVQQQFIVAVQDQSRVQPPQPVR
jgi:hypothetical protein